MPFIDKTPTHKNFRINLQAGIDRLGLTRRQFSRTAGVKVENVNHYLVGRCIPRDEDMARIAAALGTTAKELTGTSTDKKPKRTYNNLAAYNAKRSEEAAARRLAASKTAAVVAVEQDPFPAAAAVEIERPTIRINGTETNPSVYLEISREVSLSAAGRIYEILKEDRSARI